jgi:ATP-dependent RNA helicase DDX24/MAK5
VEKLDFRDENPEVIDLSPEGGVVKQLKESMVECVATDKVSRADPCRVVTRR